MALECIWQPGATAWCRGDGTSCVERTTTLESKPSLSRMERSDLKKKLKCRSTLDSCSSCDGVAGADEVGANAVAVVVVAAVAAVAAVVVDADDDVAVVVVVVVVVAAAVGDKLRIGLSAVGEQRRQLTAGWTNVKRPASSSVIFFVNH